MRADYVVVKGDVPLGHNVPCSVAGQFLGDRPQPPKLGPVGSQIVKTFGNGPGIERDNHFLRSARGGRRLVSRGPAFRS